MHPKQVLDCLQSVIVCGTSGINILQAQSWNSWNCFLIFIVILIIYYLLLQVFCYIFLIRNLFILQLLKIILLETFYNNTESFCMKPCALVYWSMGCVELLVYEVSGVLRTPSTTRSQFLCQHLLDSKQIFVIFCVFRNAGLDLGQLSHLKYGTLNCCSCNAK